MAVTSTYDEKQFGAHFLADIIDYINENFGPNDVYTDDVLKGYISESWGPEDVFSHAELAAWAKSNSFVEA